MDRPVAEKIVELLRASHGIMVVDITGGAPELNGNFRWLVEQSRKLDLQVIDRCNLSVLLESGMADLPKFLADHEIRIVASLPCYSRENVDEQRGRGTFDKSIKALRTLNDLGYGQEGTRLQLDLVYNPGGPFLPPSQKKLEQDYKVRLREEFGIAFNQLLTLTNLPILRFETSLRLSGDFERYSALLRDSFNAATVPGLMCRNLVSVSWDGRVYDCDFNQQLGIPLGYWPRMVWDLKSFDEVGGRIATGPHCFGCTAGAGSSCGGALA